MIGNICCITSLVDSYCAGSFPVILKKCFCINNKGTDGQNGWLPGVKYCTTYVPLSRRKHFSLTSGSLHLMWRLNTRELKLKNQTLLCQSVSQAERTHSYLLTTVLCKGVNIFREMDVNDDVCVKCLLYCEEVNEWMKRNLEVINVCLKSYLWRCALYFVLWVSRMFP